jgi:membrane associated rhomboid family serine protease
MAFSRMQGFNYKRAGGQPSEPWFRMGPVEATTTNIVTALCVLSFFTYAVNPAINWRLVLLPESVFRGQIWRIVTWPIPNVPGLLVAFSVATFWYFGNHLERTLGRRRFFALFGAVVLIPTALLLALRFPEAGIHPVSFAFFIGFAVQNPEAEWFFGIKLWMIAAAFVGLETLRLTGNRQFHELLVLLVSVSVVIAGLRSFGEAQFLPKFPKLPLIDRVRTTKHAKTLSGVKTRNPSSTGKRSESTKSGSTKNSSKGSTVVAGPWPSGGISKYEVDRLLEKIGQTGIDSLSADERTTLDRASKNLRDRRDE